MSYYKQTKSTAPNLSPPCLGSAAFAFKTVGLHSRNHTYNRTDSGQFPSLPDTYTDYKSPTICHSIKTHVP